MSEEDDNVLELNSDVEIIASDDDLQKHLEHHHSTDDDEDNQDSKINNDFAYVDTGHLLFNCNEPIYCCAVNTLRHMVALGTGDDRFLLIDYNLNKILLSDNFSESVNIVKFNRKGNLICAADLAGVLKVWHVDKIQDAAEFDSNQSSLIWTYDEGAEITFITWHNLFDNVLFAGTINGSLWMWKIVSGECKYFQGKSQSSLITLELFPCGLYVLAAFADGGIVKWNLKDGVTEAYNVLSDDPHNCEPICSIINKVGNYAFFGLKEGRLIVMSVAKQLTKLHDLVVIHDDSPNEFRYIESLCLNESETILSVGCATGDIVFYNLADYTIYSKYSVEQSPSVIKMIQLKSSIVAAYYDGFVRIVDARTCRHVNQVALKQCFNDAILDFELIDDKRFIAVSESGKAKIFELP
ncbi:hypothetical protein GJ496_009077 [Pomphorhynchus laevis]|nr:hypothetical protein GJ496_009077 [Pomphorhynchus laevis]